MPCKGLVNNLVNIKISEAELYKTGRFYKIKPLRLANGAKSEMYEIYKKENVMQCFASNCQHYDN